MLCPKTQPPWEFLLSASRNSLQSYELSRLAYAANLKKEIDALLDQWLEENACAMLARLLIQQRERPARAPDPGAAKELFAARGGAVSDNVFANRAAGPHANHSSA